MPREVISVHVGQAGNQSGATTFELYRDEHCLDGDSKYSVPRKPNGKPDKQSEEYKAAVADDDGDGVPDCLEEIDVFFHPLNIDDGGDYRLNTTWVPRCIVVDLEPGVVSGLKDSHKGFHKQIDDQDLHITGASGAGNNWAKGHYTEGAEHVENVMEKIRVQQEKCDATQAFTLYHSIGGGTGSGFGTLILLKIRDSYPDKITCSYSIYPSPKVSDTVVEPYNAVLSTHQLLENSDETFIIDNEALMNIQHNILQAGKDADFKKMNSLIAKVSCGVTCPLRFQGSINADLRKLGTNLVPFPRLHFFMIGESPLADVANKAFDLQTCVSEVNQKSHAFSNCEYESGKTMAASITFRTPTIDQQKCEEEVNKNQEKTKTNGLMVEWIPNNFKIGVVNTPRLDTTLSATAVINTTALKAIFQRLATQFGALFKRKAFLHWYKGEGMDEMEFQEADKNVRDLITEYQDKENARYAEDSEGSQLDNESDE
jgi:tubulin beta